MGGNRKHGFARGNANGRRARPRHTCSKCGKIKTGDFWGENGKTYCDSCYGKILDQRQSEWEKARIDTAPIGQLTLFA